MNKKEKKSFLLGIGVGVVILVIFFSVFLLVNKPEQKTRSGSLDFILKEGAKAAGGEKSAPGKLAEDFEFTTVFGEKFKLSDFRGKPAIIEIFSTWCGICISETDDFRKVLNNFPDINIISIDIDPTETDQDIKRFVRAYAEGFDRWFFARDTDQVAIKYGAPFTGTTILLDKDGRIAYRDSYSTSYEKLESELIQLGLESLGVDYSDTSLDSVEEIRPIDLAEELETIERNFANQRFRLATLEIKGITCPSCIKIIRDDLRDVEGVVETILSIEDGIGLVVYDPDFASLEDDIIGNNVFSKNTDYEWTYTADLLEDKKL